MTAHTYRSSKPTEELGSGASAPTEPTAAFVPSGSSPSGLDQRLQSTSGHTPGPWHEGCSGNNRVYGPDGRGEDSGLIAVVYKGSANRRLIAAAPELLKALQWAIEEVEGGRLYDRMCCDGYHCGCQGSDNAAFLVHHLRETVAKATGAA